MLDFFPIRWSTVWLTFWVGLGSPRVRTGLFDRHTLNDSNKTINFRVAWHTDIPNKWMTYKSIQKKERERKKTGRPTPCEAVHFDWLGRTQTDSDGRTDGWTEGRNYFLVFFVCARRVGPSAELSRPSVTNNARAGLDNIRKKKYEKSERNGWWHFCPILLVFVFLLLHCNAGTQQAEIYDPRIRQHKKLQVISSGCKKNWGPSTDSGDCCWSVRQSKNNHCASL